MFHFQLTGSLTFETADRPDLSELPASRRSFSTYLREKIHANLSQRRHRPLRHLGHVASIRLAEVSTQEFRIPVLDDGRSDFAHQSEQVMHVVHRQSMQTNKGQLAASRYVVVLSE